MSSNSGSTACLRCDRAAARALMHRTSGTTKLRTSCRVSPDEMKRTILALVLLVGFSVVASAGAQKPPKQPGEDDPVAGGPFPFRLAGGCGAGHNKRAGRFLFPAPAERQPALPAPP